MNRAIEASKRLYGSPSCQPGEALSSWVWRVAAFHRLSPPLLSKRWGFFNDLAVNDVRSPKASPERLAFLTATEPATFTYQFQLRWGVLRERRSLWFDAFSGKPILQWCPVCLGSGEVPFLRLLWRFRTKILCEEHGVLLRCACHVCGAGMSLFSSRRRRLDHCNSCGANLAAAQALTVTARLNDEIGGFQRRAFAIVANEDAALGKLSEWLTTPSGMRGPIWGRWHLLDFEECFGDLAREAADAIISGPKSFAESSAHEWVSRQTMSMPAKGDLS